MVMGWFCSTLHIKKWKYNFLDPALSVSTQPATNIHLPNNNANPNFGIVFRETTHLKFKKKCYTERSIIKAPLIVQT